MYNLENSAVVNFIRKALQERTETPQVEFKDARGGFSPNIWESISSFSNSPGGGMIVFGVKEDRKNQIIKVVGGLDLATLQEKILSFLTSSIVNPGKYNLKIINYYNTQLLVLLIAETPRELKPCYYPTLGLPKGACVREGNTNRKISDEEMRVFIRYSRNYKYDRTQAVGTNIKMLSDSKIFDFMHKSEKKTGRTFSDKNPSIKVMRNLGLVDEFEGDLTPTLAGFLIFSKEQPQLYDAFSRYTVRCVRFSGNATSSSIIDSSDINGSLDEQIDNTHRFILRNISKGAYVEGTKRIETYEYPEAALREIVVNAIIHRDYMITGTYISVNIFPNRIEVSNPGNLPPGVTIDNIKIAQFSRNEVISKILRDYGYMEEFGRGIDLVFASMFNSGLPEPIFKDSSNMFKVTLLGGLYKGLNERQIKIWSYLQDNKTITARSAHNMFPQISRPTINNDLKEMINLDLITQKGSSSNTYYEPDY